MQFMNRRLDTGEVGGFAAPPTITTVTRSLDKQEKAMQTVLAQSEHLANQVGAVIGDFLWQKMDIKPLNSQTLS